MILAKEYKDFILKKEFFKAHEALEEYWFPRRKTKSREVLIVKGFINAAVAFELKKRGRLERALKVWETYLKFSKLIESNDTLFIELKSFIEEYGQNYLFDAIISEKSDTR